MKAKILIILSIIVLIFIIATTFLKKDYYRVDCEKDLKGYDVIFVYMRGCKHCYNDLINIKELNLLDKIYMVDASNQKCKNIIKEYSDYIIYHKNSNLRNVPKGIYVPTKICIYNNKTYIGSMEKEELKSFFENCK
ncbi:MAG: hypothetical protein RMJ17_03835 [Candidatus Aenigmarchaeota archaeon]|nr:hypothetical protein [Candidatus Aenigmarchaeota archaeon]MDW8149693.1 hypothetical protein [Candidatus Aenigmarchaeota archaeon]